MNLKIQAACPLGVEDVDFKIATRSILANWLNISLAI